MENRRWGKTTCHLGREFVGGQLCVISVVLVRAGEKWRVQQGFFELVAELEPSDDLMNSNTANRTAGAHCCRCARPAHAVLDAGLDAVRAQQSW